MFIHDSLDVVPVWRVASVSDILEKEKGAPGVPIDYATIALYTQLLSNITPNP